VNWMLEAKFHVPVLLKETIDLLRVKPKGKYIDATLGGGGHARAIIKAGGEVLGIDRDPQAIKYARETLKACPIPKNLRDLCLPPKVTRGNFKQIDEIAQKFGFTEVEGILFDLGVSSHQLETAARGFSFSLPGPLDMRMEPGLSVTAADLVNALNEGELYELFTKLGEEKRARRFARAICRARRVKKIETCEELTKIILANASPKARFERIHPATQVFQALRIAVNDELNNLKEALPKASGLLKKGGRLIVISFHSLEDGIVKRFFLESERKGVLEIISKKPLVPSKEEIRKNPRSRSAKLRAGERKK